MATVGYTTTDALSAYATARGVTITGDTSVLLLKALDWLELQPFAGVKSVEDQTLQFPRDGYTETPDNIVTAQIVAALIIDGGFELTGKSERVVKKEKVGPLEVEYALPDVDSYPQLQALLRDYLTSSGRSFTVVRA